MKTTTTHIIEIMWVVSICGIVFVGRGMAFSRGWIPESIPTGVTIFDIEGSAPDNAFVAGANGVLLHNSGAGWYQMSTGLPGDVKAIYSFDSDRAFSVGYDHITEEWGLAEYNGIDWQVVENGFNDVPYDIWGPDESVIYVPFKSGKLMQYDGAWNVFLSAPEDLYGVWGTASDDIFVCGTEGYIANYNGVSWAVMGSGTMEQLYNIWGASGNCVYAVGTDGTVLYYNGMNWSSINLSSSYNMWHVDGVSWDDVFISSGHGEVHHFDGISWTPMNVGADATLLCCWQAAWDVAYTGGIDGYFFKYDGQPPPTFTPAPPTSTPTPTPTPTITPTEGSPTITPTFTSTPPPTFTAFPTYTPWPTSTFPYSPTPSPTANNTQNPNTTPTPASPTSTFTPAPCDQTGVEVFMPTHHFHGGDTCYCRIVVCNAEGRKIRQAPLFVVLDVYGRYFYGPTMTEQFNHYLTDYPVFEQGTTTITVLPEFKWPGNAGEAWNIYWYSALVNEQMTQIIGKMGVFTFGWSP